MDGSSSSASSEENKTDNIVLLESDDHQDRRKMPPPPPLLSSASSSQQQQQPTPKSLFRSKSTSIKRPSTEASTSYSSERTSAQGNDLALDSENAGAKGSLFSIISQSFKSFNATATATSQFSAGDGEEEQEDEEALSLPKSTGTFGRRRSSSSPRRRSTVDQGSSSSSPSSTTTADTSPPLLFTDQLLDESDPNINAFPAMDSAQRQSKIEEASSLSSSSMMPPTTSSSSQNTSTGSATSSSLSSSGPQLQRAPRKKVPLDPGHSPIDWARLTTSGGNIAGVEQLRRYSPSELAEHNKKADCWIAFQGKVYNCTHYLKFHPGK